MTFYTGNEFKKKTIWSRSIEVIPSLTLNLYQNYKIESIRFSWLGFTIGLGQS
jgi:hypothetical protein